MTAKLTIKLLNAVGGGNTIGMKIYKRFALQKGEVIKSLPRKYVGNVISRLFLSNNKYYFYVYIRSAMRDTKVIVQIKTN